ncbi:GMC family oxidoreductase N-terminal domain-containing protein [Paludibacterium paludis]|uniref:GMC family oxidoreductase n=1 Tax=Paludibacterium paludis TaxID=1225769 RepID=A0A918UBN7_9NEIS|nr:GMC family oxidoreductase [Paludibacterium paludis]GGY23725.1 GMC family oxidoreductase [Paludibacterium paludis]
MVHDYIIVGSGPSGAVMADALTRAGADCLMLEAGEARPSPAFPDNELAANSRLFWGGGMELSRDARTVLLRGKALGGGSIVNQCLLDRFDELAFSLWRQASGIAGLSLEAFEPWYRRTENRLALETLGREGWNRNAALYAEAFERCGYGCAPLRRGQSDCGGNDCVVCLGGCRRGSKQSTLMTFLPQACRQGLTIRCGCQVEALSHDRHGVTVTGYLAGRPEVWRARKVVLAAGALGTTGILLRSGLKSRLPALGEGFFCHPQWMTLALFDEIVDAHKGALQSLKSDEPRFRQAGFKLENIFAGPVAISLLAPGIGKEAARWMRDYRRMASIEVAIRDETPGRVRLAGGRLEVEKTLGDTDRARRDAGLAVVRELFGAVGAKKLHQAPLRIGLHLMGGCALGVDGARSVTAPDHRVHDHPNLLIADSACFPAAPGINPSLSIMALSGRAAAMELGQAALEPVREAAA